MPPIWEQLSRVCAGVLTCGMVREFALHLVRERLATGQSLIGLTPSLVAKAYEQHEALQPAAGETGETGKSRETGEKEKTELLHVLFV